MVLNVILQQFHEEDLILLKHEHFYYVDFYFDDNDNVCEKLHYYVHADESGFQNFWNFLLQLRL